MYLEQGLKGKNRWWRYLVTVAVTVFGTVLGNIPLGILLVFKMTQYGGQAARQFQATMDFSLLGIPEALGLLLIMLPFVMGLASLLFSVAVIHGKKLKDFTTAAPKLRPGRFFLAAGIWLVLGLLADLVSWLINPADYSFVFEPARFFPVALVALCTVPLQAAFEEFLFRGYMSQGMATLFRGRGLKWGRIIPIIVTGTLFGFFHSANPEISNYGFLFMLPQYVIMGVVLSVVTVMDDGLEAALGIHAANNLYGILVVNLEGSAIQMPSLFRAGNYDPKTGLITLVVFSAVSLVVFKLAFRWPGFKKVFAPLQKENLS
jgi:membrane protease YdiL (CAAX protease family)